MNATDFQKLVDLYQQSGMDAVIEYWSTSEETQQWRNSRRKLDGQLMEEFTHVTKCTTDNQQFLEAVLKTLADPSDAIFEICTELAEGNRVDWFEYMFATHNPDKSVIINCCSATLWEQMRTNYDTTIINIILNHPNAQKLEQKDWVKIIEMSFRYGCEQSNIEILKAAPSFVEFSHSEQMSILYVATCHPFNADYMDHALSVCQLTTKDIDNLLIEMINDSDEYYFEQRQDIIKRLYPMCCSVNVLSQLEDNEKQTPWFKDFHAQMVHAEISKEMPEKDLSAKKRM